MMLTRTKNATRTERATGSTSVMDRAICQPGQNNGDWNPGELVPVEERYAENRGLPEIVERDPQQADIWNEQQQQDPHGSLRFSPLHCDVLPDGRRQCM